MTANRNRPGRQQSLISIAVIAILLILYYFFGRNISNQHPVDRREKEFRHNEITYTKHARCRMDCRHIDEQEVKEIVQNGEINYRKSEIHNSPCPKYALEGMTHDNQRVRLIVGNCDKEVVIITVIDLDHEFECACE